jgi:hypothetical protein
MLICPHQIQTITKDTNRVCIEQLGSVFESFVFIWEDNLLEGWSVSWATMTGGDCFNLARQETGKEKQVM